MPAATTGTYRPPADAAGGAPADNEESVLAALEREREDVRLARQALSAAMERYGALEAEMIRKSEGQVAELALEIAAKVLMQQIRAERHEIDPIVKEALSRVPARREAVVRLNPADLAKSALAAESRDGSRGVRFVGDPAIPRCGCVVETAEGFIQADVAAHYKALADLLRGGE
jgi:flagellar biosynthesis/type III secretory pathway protein FliH